MADIDAFVSELIAARGPEAEQAGTEGQLHADLVDEVDDHINGMILDHLPEDAQDVFEHLLDGGDEEKIRAFLLVYIHDLDARIERVLQDFRRQYLG